MTSVVLSVSLSVTPDQLDWLEHRRQRGLLSRSAVIRQVIDDAIAAERANAGQPGLARAVTTARL
jgi:metal-responsive CopG/Arc/MetJ family transcriptional regulator